MTDSPKKPVRVRFAPSPTGPLHIGGARTALFNWLFARKNNGSFVLRIEDTDVERSDLKFEKEILDGLKWLGLDWDEGPITQNNTDYTRTKTEKIPSRSVSGPQESVYKGEYGPYRQSERLNIHEKYLQQLLNENKAYWCFCSKEQLESDRQAMLAGGLAPKYSGRCRSLRAEESEARRRKGESAVIRFRVREAVIEFSDIIRGRIKFDAALTGDIIIAKDLKSPLYNFSAVIDDALMKISHVIRGEEHLSNTPKQILIQRALDFEEIKYAHLPLILDAKRRKLSKRFSDAALDDFRKQGYLPEALANFLALLGWHPSPSPESTANVPLPEKEIFTREELIAEFDLKRVQKAGAVFNIEKLNWLNSEYIKNTNSRQLTKNLEPFIPREWTADEEFLIKIIDLEKERIEKLTDFAELAAFFFALPDYKPELLHWPRPAPTETKNKEDKEKIAANLNLLYKEIDTIFKIDFNKKKLEEVLMPLTEVWGRGELLWPLRAALSGSIASPGPFEIMEILGKEETLRRINIAIEKLSK